MFDYLISNNYLKHQYPHYYLAFLHDWSIDVIITDKTNGQKIKSNYPLKFFKSHPRFYFFLDILSIFILMITNSIYYYAVMVKNFE